MNTTTEMNLREWDRIVINTSAGKDSQAMADFICTMAKEQGVIDRVVMVHADLGKVEWAGTKELAEEHAKHYGVPIVIVRREKGDLLATVLARGMWPDSGNRYCTSDQKRDQVSKFHTATTTGMNLDRQARILNCMGFRAEESPARAKRQVFETDKRNTNGKRLVANWLPIHAWTTKQVWARIATAGTRYHHAYDLGMPRLSCCFCIFAPKAALMIAGKHNPALLDEYVAVEKTIGHTFRHGFAIAEVKAALERGEEPEIVQSWAM